MTDSRSIVLRGAVSSFKFGERDGKGWASFMLGQIFDFKKQDGSTGQYVYTEQLIVSGKYQVDLVRNLSVGDVVTVAGQLNYKKADDGKAELKIYLSTIFESSEPDDVVLEVESRVGLPLLKDGLNEVRLSGGFTRDVKSIETKGSGGGMSVGSIGVSEWRGQTQESVPHYFEFKAFGQPAEKIRNASKGDKVILVGKLVNDSYVDKSNVKVYQKKIEVSRVLSVQRKKLTVPEWGDGQDGQTESDLPF